MTKVRFVSGMRTIGGTIIEVINGKDRIVFDFGCVFDPSNKTDELPKVKGIMDKDNEYNDAVIISHNHLDHIKALNLIDKNIPIYMHSDSIKLLSSLKSIGWDDILGEWRGYNAIKVNEKTKINSFEVTAFEVDHDVVGAVSYLIQTENVNILYTGDLRLHGICGNKTLEMIKNISEVKIDILIIEGVSISFIEDDYKVVASKEFSDEVAMNKFVERNLREIQKGKVNLFNPYIMGFEIKDAFVKMAEMSNKKIVFLPEDAKVFSDFNEEKHFVLENDKFNSGFEVINWEEIDSKFMVQFKFSEKELYNNIKAEKQIIQAGGEPLGEFDPNWNVLKQYCKENAIDFSVFSNSGHATPENLKYIADQIDATILIPIHSYKPDLLKPLNGMQILPEPFEVLEFKSHEMINRYIENKPI